MAYKQIPYLHPNDAATIGSTIQDTLVYRAKETVSSLDVEQDKFYYITERGEHKLFSTGGLPGVGSSPLTVFTCTTPIEISDEIASGFTTGIGSHVIKTSEVQVGSVYKVQMFGRMIIAESSSDVINMTIKLGNTTLYTEQFGLLGEDVGLFVSLDISVTAIGENGIIYVISPDPVGPFLTHTFPKNLQTDATPKTIDFRTNKTIDIIFESTGTDAVATILSSNVIKLN